MSILEEAEALINSDRAKDYGDMTESFTRIAGLWSAYLGVDVDKYDAAKMMVLLKVSRAKNGNHYDSLVDIVGYCLCVEKMMEEKQKEN